MTEQTQNGATAGGADPNTQQAGAGGDPPFWNALPENMRDTTAEGTLRKLLPSWQGYHKAHTERAPALAKVEDVVLEITHEKAKGFFDPKSPMAGAFARAAVDAGLNKAQANKIADVVLGQLADGGLLSKPIDAKQTVTEIAKVLGHATLDDNAKAAVAQFETEALAYAANFGKQLKLSENAQVELESLTLTPGGVELIRALQGASGGPGFALGGRSAADGPMTKEKLHEMGKDERLDPYSAKYDKAFRQQYDEAWAKANLNG